VGDEKLDVGRVNKFITEKSSFKDFEELKKDKAFITVIKGECKKSKLIDEDTYKNFAEMFDILISDDEQQE
jgi:hypothetical protein